MEWHAMWQTIETWLNGQGFKLGLIILSMILALVLVKVLTGQAVRLYKRLHSERELQKRAETLGIMFRYAAAITVFAVAGMMTLDLLGVRLGPMLAAAGVVGIAIGFGAQHLVQDITNGFFLMLDDEVRIGDVVRAGGEYGTVERISLRHTVLRSIDGNVHFIPNSKIDTVTNMTKTFSYCMLRIGVAFREDIEEVFSVVENVADELSREEPFSDWIIEPIDIMGLDEFTDSAMIIKARIKVQPIRQWRVKREFNRRLKKAFDRRGIEIPFPHLTLYIGHDKTGGSPALHIMKDEKSGKIEGATEPALTGKAKALHRA